MAEHSTPKFHNDMGIRKIAIGAKKFQCTGAHPPFDHPHVFIDMGEENETICPYCSTLYQHDPALKPHESHPAEAAYDANAA